MAAINTKRVWLGALVGAIVFIVWDMTVNFAVLASLYASAQRAGQFLMQPRYPFFIGVWFLTLFLISAVIAWLYAGVRSTYGPGPMTALKVGVLVGFVAGFPLDFSIATWSTMDRIFPLWWMLELWVGSILSAFVSGWLYREA